jgi:hypothetical protein
VTTGRRWLLGCGVGCGVLLLVGIGSCVVGALFLKHTFRGIEKASSSYEALIAEMGDVRTYVPPPDGAPPPDRLELFVAIREDVAGERARVERGFAGLPPPELNEDGAIIGKIKPGLELLGDLIDGIGTYLQARNHALLERRMGLGEYVYIYTLAYYSGLGHTPGEAPEVRQDRDGVRVGVFDEDSGVFNEQALRRRYRRYILPMVHAQLGSLEPQAEAGDGETWRSQLEREIQRLEVDPGRVLWQDGLPPAIEDSLQPFRDRLEATYSRSTNPVELPLAEHEVPWEWE